MVDVKRIIRLFITLTNGLPTLSGEPLDIAGTQYDHNIQVLEFASSTELADYDLHLLFRDMSGAEFRVNIGQKNEYMIPNALTQTTELSLHIELRKGSDSRVGANELKFRYQSSRSGGETPEPIPDPVADLIAGAATGGTYDTEAGSFVFTNLQGDETFNIPFSGGSGGDISSPDISKILVMDRIDYDALPEKSPKTLYLIRG